MNGTQITFGDYYDFQYLPTLIKDRNGNFINIYYKTLSNNERVIDYVKDTLGRTIEFYYENNRLTKIRQNRAGTYYDFISISWAPITITTNFQVATDPANINNTTIWQPWFVQYPTGINTRFFYTSYGQVYLIEKWVPTIAGQERRIAYTRYNLPSYNGYYAPAGPVAGPVNNSSQLSDPPAFTARYEWAENWNNSSGMPQEAAYYYYFDSSGNFSTVTDPMDRVYRTDSSSGCSTQTISSKLYASTASYNNGAGTPLRTVTTISTQDSVYWSGYTYWANLRPIEITITDGTYTKRTLISYISSQGVNLPADIDEYQGSSVYRRTQTDYKWDAEYIDRHIFGLPQQVRVYSGTSTLVAKTEFVYDEGYPYFLDATVDQVIQHDNINYGGSFILGRGNLTSVKQYEVPGTNWRYVRRTAYDTNGSVRKVWDGANHMVDLNPWDNFTNKPGSVGETHGTISGVTDADGFQNRTKYDWYTGLPKESYHVNATTGAQENTITYTYGSGDRLTGVYRPDGGQTTWAYWDNWLAVAQYTKLDATQTRYSFTAYDGAGNIRWNGSDHPDGVSGKYSLQKFFYDAVGRATKVSNVTAVDGNYNPIDDDAATGYLYTTLAYDALDRQTSITRPDGNVVSYSYTGCGCAGSATVMVTDERGKKRKTVADFLGRLLEAHDLTSVGATYGKAVYSYDALDRLTAINHYNSGTAYQTRSFSYDGYGQLQSQTTPEGGTVTYSYTSDDLVATVQDGRGITASFSYNNRHLLTQINYSDATPDVVYTYGEYGERTKMEEKDSSGIVIGQTEYVYDAFKRLQSERRKFEPSGVMNTTEFRVSYAYNLVDAVVQVSYTVGWWTKSINYSYTYAGAPKAVGTDLIPGDASNNVVKDVVYRGFGGIKSLSYGLNPRKLQVSYSAERQQMTNVLVQRTDNTDPIINLSYDYYNGGNNNGRIQQITDNLDNAYSVAYSYDDYNRLSSATASAYTRSYSYDEWGNLRSVTASGGGESGSYTINYAVNASGAPATNRILNVNGGGVTFTIRLGI